MTSPTYVVVDLEDNILGVVFGYGPKKECLSDWIAFQYDLDLEDDADEISEKEQYHDLKGPYQLIQ